MIRLGQALLKKKDLISPVDEVDQKKEGGQVMKKVVVRYTGVAVGDE